MQQYKGKKIAIVGLSVEGIDTAKYFAKHQADVTLLDRRSKAEFGSEYEEITSFGFPMQLGGGYLDNLSSFDVIVRTPGMALHTPEFIAAKQQGRTITSLTKLFFSLCPAPIIGITGTKGKGTTSTLIYEILKAAHIRTWLGGNVGVPLLSRVDDMHATDVVVLELSSFQLEDLSQSPKIAVVLPITQDHLSTRDPRATNFHATRDAYVAAKTSIVTHQSSDDMLIYNGDNESSASMRGMTPATAYSYGKNPSFSAFVADHAVWLFVQGKKEKICTASDIQLVGDHNLENIAAASLVAHELRIPLSVIRLAVRAFKGLPHRLEFVREFKGVSYYNDSFSTVPETTIAAIQSFDNSKVLVLGGSEKGSDFTALGREVAKASVRALIVIGEMKVRILEAIKESGWKGEIIDTCDSMADIVRCAYAAAKPGDVVLFSPGCASFDMFPNYKDRGIQFVTAVQALS